MCDLIVLVCDDYRHRFHFHVNVFEPNQTTRIEESKSFRSTNNQSEQTKVSHFWGCRQLRITEASTQTVPGHRSVKMSKKIWREKYTSSVVCNTSAVGFKINAVVDREKIIALGNNFKTNAELWVHLIDNYYIQCVFIIIFAFITRMSGQLLPALSLTISSSTSHHALMSSPIITIHFFFGLSPIFLYSSTSSTTSSLFVFSQNAQSVSIYTLSLSNFSTMFLTNLNPLLHIHS